MDKQCDLPIYWEPGKHTNMAFVRIVETTTIFPNFKRAKHENFIAARAGVEGAVRGYDFLWGKYQNSD